MLYLLWKVSGFYNANPGCAQYNNIIEWLMVYLLDRVRLKTILLQYKSNVSVFDIFYFITVKMCGLVTGSKQ